VFLNKSVIVILLKTVNSLICIWDFGNSHNLTDDCPEVDKEGQDCQDHYADPDIYG
jgi:hypothetical protein